MNDLPEGFTVPLHRALTEPIRLGGAPRALAIVNGTIAAAIGLGLQQWLAGLLLALGGHSLAVLVSRRDPHIAAILVRHLRQAGGWSC